MCDADTSANKIKLEDLLHARIRYDWENSSPHAYREYISLKILTNE